jgi:hypothetical protein
MTNGERNGYDLPFTPLGCQMRWFSTKQICEILNRFERIVFIGDSLTRYLVGAMNILVRQDLGLGALAQWDLSTEDR